MEQPLPVHKGDEPYVFICYAHKDKDVVYPEIRLLQDQGNNVWWDEGINPGSEWSDALAEAIEGCTQFLYFITPHSVVAENCRRELNHAVAENRELLAVYLEETDVPGGIRLHLHNRQAILRHELESNSYREKLQRALRQTVNTASNRDTAQQPARVPSERSLYSTTTIQTEIHRSSKHHYLRIAIVFVIAVAGIVGWRLIERGSDEAVMIVAGLAEVRDLVGENQYAEAYARARALEPSLADEGLRDELWSVASRTLDLTSNPTGAQVWMRPYNSTEQDWLHLGRTPLLDARLPLKSARLRLELEGYTTLHVTETRKNLTFRLDQVNFLPKGMVRVLGREFLVTMPGLEHLSIELPDFLIDATEVTNEQYKRFVDAGGYRNPDYWDQKFVQDDRQLSFDTAMELFRDQTGRAGPSTWEVGSYLDGMADHPVGGISWYEAVAYARFVGKQLPSLYHWYVAADPRQSEFIVPLSNFNRQGTARAGTYDGVSPSGLHDAAGNVREWIWNRSDDEHFLLGGGWSDPEYYFNDANAQSPFDRDKANGFRLMTPLDTSNLELAREPIVRSGRNYFAEQPVSEETFAVYRRLYAYDATPLNAEVVAREEVGHWAREKIELDAAYGNERLTAYLYLPADTEPPYSPIVYFPGSQVIYQSEIKPAENFRHHYLLRSGRAVLYPVYKGTLDRGTELKSDVQDESNFYREHVVQWSKDLGRSLDYLETRTDIDMDRVGYFGFSWGSSIAPVMLAIEPRIKTAMLVVGGLVLQPTQPEVDPFNFLPRVKVPTRMLNASNDYFFPLETSQKPFYEFLDAEPKDRVLIDITGHTIPLNTIARETLDWFDEHLGPAQ